MTRSRVIYHTNSAFTLHSFRLRLMREMQSRGYEVIACGPRDAYADKIEAHGIRFEHVPFHLAGVNPLRESRVIWALHRLYRRERPALVHHFSLKPVAYGSIAARMARVPVIVNTVTGLGYAFSEQSRLREVAIALLRTACRKNTWLTFQNPEDKALFERLGITTPERSVLILGSGVDAQRFQPTALPDPHEIRSRPLRFLMFGRMMWDKGVAEYVEAAKRVRARAAGATPPMFVLLGGASASNPTGVAQEWLANPNTIPGEWLDAQAASGEIEYHPHDDDVLSYILDADVVVLPSYYPEGLPRSLLEAMACARAIITTDTPGCREVVAPSVNGYTVPPKDVDALARVMMAMVDDPALVTRMGLESRRMVIERFSDEVVIAQTLEFYRRAGVS